MLMKYLKNNILLNINIFIVKYIKDLAVLYLSI